MCGVAGAFGSVRMRGQVMAGCAGLMLGAAVLTKANLAPFALFAPLWLAVPGQCRMTPGRQRWWAALGLCGRVGADRLTLIGPIVPAHRLGYAVEIFETSKATRAEDRPSDYGAGNSWLVLIGKAIHNKAYPLLHRRIESSQGFGARPNPVCKAIYVPSYIVSDKLQP